MCVFNAVIFRNTSGKNAVDFAIGEIPDSFSFHFANQFIFPIHERCHCNPPAGYDATGGAGFG
jgi:hypothetical protein